MENSIIEIIKFVNPVQLGLIVFAVFYFYNRIDVKIDSVKDEIKSTNARIDNLSSRVDRLNDAIIDLYKTLLNKRDAA